MPSARSNPSVDITRILKYAPAELIGRDDETKYLDDAWTKVLHRDHGRPRVLTFVALGGEGKTSLVAKWAAKLAEQDWPECEAAFAWSFYSRDIRGLRAASSDLFLKEALSFFATGTEEEVNQTKIFAASPAGADEKGRRLARLVGQPCRLLILDGLEPLQHPPGAREPGKLKDDGVAALLLGLAENSSGLCIITTRYSLPDLRAFWRNTAPELRLPRLSSAAGIRLLRTLGVTGAEQDFKDLVEDVKGHALALTVLGSFLKRAFHGDIRMRNRVKFEKADHEMDGGHAFRVMAAYEQWLLGDGGEAGRREVAVLRLMGLFDRPAEANCLRALLQPPAIPGLTTPLVGLTEEDWETCLNGLAEARLLTVNREPSESITSLDAHPHIREYFAKRVSEGTRLASFMRRLWHRVFGTNLAGTRAWCQAHRRLYDHLCKHEEGSQPTIEDLQPLFQAVIHGVQAGLHARAFNEVYWKRIVREEYSNNHRAFGASNELLAILGRFFTEPWSHANPKVLDAAPRLLLEAGTYLFNLGQLKEGCAVLKKASHSMEQAEDFAGAARAARLASEAHLLLGELEHAWAQAIRAWEQANKGDQNDRKIRIEQLIAQAASGHVAHQRNPRGDTTAGYWYEKATRVQRKLAGGSAELYGAAGVWYVDWLIEMRDFEKADKVAQWVGKRAREHGWVMATSLYHALIALMLHTKYGNKAKVAKSTATKAVDEMRLTGQQHHLVTALITRARLLGDRDQAIGDFDEAWEISFRANMKLFMADILLFRARLFYRIQPYPWQDDDPRDRLPRPIPSRENSSETGPDTSLKVKRTPKDDLDEAERLIKKCSYHRRDQELADGRRDIGS
ncbi:MAG: hypothetical protein H7A47_12795 [Verrucomicrobiales bacterium]|nr:hypothetical protein [Verrucomicrobiales bacterium]